MKYSIIDHVFGALLTIIFMSCCGATIYHNYCVNNDPVVQAVTDEALQWKEAQK